MSQIDQSMAQALLNLIATIDGNSEKHPDWVDAVCSAREKLPESAVKALEDIAGKEVKEPMTESERDALCYYHEEQAKEYEKILARTGSSSMRSYITHHREMARKLREQG